ncbi:MAG: aminopeptidase [Xanthomonadaceae bacterium]|nr:aminopeptidase [Xanthomonadaceae bacterium]
MLFVSLLSLSSCATGKGEVGLSYYLQAAGGQFAILNRARPISEVLASHTTPPRIKKFLEEIPRIKKFGETYAIKPTNNYESYVKWDHPSVSYVVTAIKPTKFEAKRWSLPIAGSFEYLGWFDPERAKKFAVELDEEGWDTEVRGAQAYSTVGYFNDPVLSTMFWDGDEAMGGLVNTIIHESMHATIYIKDQTSFDESLASFIADRLTPIYLAERFGKDSVDAKSFKASQENYDMLVKKYTEAYQKLDQVYQSQATEEEKLAKKAAIIGELKSALKIERKFNNASIYQYKIYHRAGSEFEAFFEKMGKDLKRSVECLKRAEAKLFQSPQQQNFGEVVMTLTKVCLGGENS